MATICARKYTAPYGRNDVEIGKCLFGGTISEDEVVLRGDTNGNPEAVAQNDNDANISYSLDSRVTRFRSNPRSSSTRTSDR